MVQLGISPGIRDRAAGPSFDDLNDLDARDIVKATFLEKENKHCIDR